MAERAALDPSQPSRRAVLRAGLTVGLSAALTTLTTAGCSSAPPAETMSVAGGETGGFYLEFATLLAAALQRHEVTARANALRTGGSLDNLDRLRAGEATVAIALADAAAERIAKEAADPRAGRTLALGKVYENYLHVVVRRDSDIRAFTDLAGNRVSVGGTGSGTAVTARRLLTSAGLAVDAAAQPDQSVTTLALGLGASIAALRDGTVDALFWSGGVPTAALVAANDELGLRLLDVSGLIGAARARYGPYYDRVRMPDGGYAGIPATWTVGVANLLLVRADLNDEVAYQSVQLLLDHPEELVPRSSLGLQFLSPETLINTAGIPLHSAAETAYRDFHG